MTKNKQSLNIYQMINLPWQEGKGGWEKHASAPWASYLHGNYLFFCLFCFCLFEWWVNKKANHDSKYLWSFLGEGAGARWISRGYWISLVLRTTSLSSNLNVKSLEVSSLYEYCVLWKFNKVRRPLMLSFRSIL